MAIFYNSSTKINTALVLLVFCGVYAAEAAMDPSFELDPKTLSGTGTALKSTPKNEKRSTVSRGEKSKVLSGKQGAVYTVKPGDHLFKILMRDYGLSNDEAESFIEEIRRENNIYDIKRLKIGQKIIIPPVLRRVDGSLKLSQSAQAFKRSNGTAPPGQSFTLESPVPVITEQEFVGRIRETWDRIVPAKPDLKKPLALHTATFSLSLDAQRYPIFAAMDGGRILLDQGGAIPPLVKSLIQEKDPSLKIVSGSPAGTKRFMSSMLEAGGFYSVEENFSMDFGVDPKLSFHADFKIEKTPESLIKQDLVLMNSGLGMTPPVLTDFLKKEGFSLYEPFASLKNFAVRSSPRTIHQITAKKQPEIVDAILKALSVSADRDRRLDVFATDNNGISLAVKAERYFERGGQRFVITSFDGDPVNYTLFRILETMGFRVVILEAKDDFKKVSEKILARMKINGSFAKHNLLQNSASSYSLQMSGFNLDVADLPGGGLFLTNLEMDRIIRDLLTENGYSIISK